MRPLALCLLYCSVCLSVQLVVSKYVHMCCLDVLCVNMSTGKTVMVEPGSIKMHQLPLPLRLLDPGLVTSLFQCCLPQYCCTQVERLQSGEKED